MSKAKTRSLSVLILIILIFLQAASGIVGGYGLVTDPSGESLQIPLEWLQGSPFNDYMIPGLILLIILGLLPLIVAIGLWLKKKWAWYGALLIGVALMIWIVVQILIVGYYPNPPLQLIYGLLGLAIAVVTLLPPVKNYYR